VSASSNSYNLRRQSYMNGWYLKTSSLGLLLPLPDFSITKKVVKGRGKRGRKRKIATQEAEEPEPEVARIIDAPVSWRAPVTQII
jgi:hypothetical protein